MKDVGEGSSSGERSDWENELWQYMSSGDGIRCPLTDTCLFENGDGCFNTEEEQQYAQLLHRFVDLEGESIDSLDASIRLRRGCVGRNRVFKLVTWLGEKYLKENWNGDLPVPESLVFDARSDSPIEIRYQRLHSVHGALWRLRDSWIIYLNKNDSQSRQRFTLFHELFHIIAHTRSTPVFKRTMDRQVYFNEVLADHFAATLLIPAKAALGKWSRKHGSISQMAAWFAVPVPVMHIFLWAHRLV